MTKIRSYRREVALSNIVLIGDAGQEVKKIVFDIGQPIHKIGGGRSKNTYTRNDFVRTITWSASWPATAKITMEMCWRLCVAYPPS